MTDNGAAGALAGFGVFALLIMAIGIAVAVFWIWALIDAIRNRALSDNERLIWILVIIFTTWIGALIYLLVGRKK